MSDQFIPDAGDQEQAEQGLREQYENDANVALDSTLRGLLRDLRDGKSLIAPDLNILCWGCGIDPTTL